MKKAYLYFENGLFLEAQSFGAEGSSVGEVVFNTSMSGHQEIVSDPSYAGQFITFTMPEIGIVGTNQQDMESRSVFCKGVIVKRYNDTPSNFRSQESLAKFLKRHNTMGIAGVDTRFLTKMLRKEGAMMMIASTDISDKVELKRLLDSSPRIEDINHIAEVSTKEPYVHMYGAFNFSTMDFSTPRTDKKIVAIDFGIKKNILNGLTEAGLCVEVVPYTFDAKDLIVRYKAGEISAVFLSNGPGDPAILNDEIARIKELIDAEIPIFAICLGHQLISLAHGYPTYKLKFGQHGGNHPVKNLKTGAVEITSQNHNYSVPEEIVEVADVIYRNLFDNTIEGVQYRNGNIYSVQHHPEASPGPKEASAIFQIFAKIARGERV
ncbi:MAG: glutamine-hydrolyzing carbamoyl-phosphate synthase small subunit [Wolinella sp.]